MAIRRIGQILVDLGYISDEQLELLVDEQKQRPGQLFGQVAMDMGLIDRRSAGPGAGRADVSLRNGRARRSDHQAKDVLDDGDRADGADVSHHPDRVRRRHAHRRDVRSAEPGRAGRTADLPRLQHPRGGGHRTGDASLPSNAITARTPKASRAWSTTWKTTPTSPPPRRQPSAMVRST